MGTACPTVDVQRGRCASSGTQVADRPMHSCGRVKSDAEVPLTVAGIARRD